MAKGGGRELAYIRTRRLNAHVVSLLISSDGPGAFQMTVEATGRCPGAIGGASGNVQGIRFGESRQG